MASKSTHPDLVRNCVVPRVEVSLKYSLAHMLNSVKPYRTMEYKPYTFIFTDMYTVSHNTVRNLFEQTI